MKKGNYKLKNLDRIFEFELKRVRKQVKHYKIEGLAWMILNWYKLLKMNQIEMLLEKMKKLTG